MHRLPAFLALCVAFCLLACAPGERPESTEAVADQPHVAAASAIEAGRYLLIAAGCNDCHTDGYLMSEGAVPEESWLTGAPIGWRGPWGTTYPPNLRMTVRNLSEDAWVEMLRSRKALPPMPWMNVNQLVEKDSRALYQYIRSLGPAGELMPAAVPPGQEPTTPFISLEPVEPEAN